ncbi:PHP domain-containing protein [Halodesulfovibrio sp. MK-HDV]|uniref:PHP domain-containing protein n=1 Tax=Halodesulfovibrio sp. MK-HDV TaxID=2599925 RepID=UPI0013FCD091|nr:hypothetical protein [Halodesulfovibrio sp. MK-HDV]KAF1073271.1 hypothetical protein MKHDV_03730 [Halodesulfovibrio sp. MK-HDV]
MSSRGSEWHKWDLHVHTPDSNLCYKNRNVTNQDIINSMAHNDISVFAITDHHYININRYQELADLGKPLGITVLPGIEFLAEARGREPVHYIGIFSEKTNLEFIWGQIKNKTAIANTYGSNPKKRNEVYCDIDDTIKLIKSLGGITTIHAGQKSNSVENITNALPHTMAQKTDLANLVDIYELGQEKDQEGYRKFVFPTINREIPMILCSDNHNALDYTVKQNCWIKGSPNFEGLKYALNEPEERFFIGSQPDVLTRLKNEPAKFLDKITINRVSDKDQQSIWFEHVDIPLNPELITIIGNKGSGKSALADITALCADGEHSTDYTFLDKDRFKKKGTSGPIRSPTNVPKWLHL